MRIFPATMALAKNFVGYAAFGRLIGDRSDETRELLADLDIKEVCSSVINVYVMSGILVSSQAALPVTEIYPSCNTLVG